MDKLGKIKLHISLMKKLAISIIIRGIIITILCNQKWRTPTLNIVTFGSCFSRFTANYLSAYYGGNTLGSIYHNRIDRFVNVFVENNISNTDKKLLEPLKINEAGWMEIGNQYPDMTLGKHKLEGKPGFMEAIDNMKVDIILLDNFLELVGRLMVPKAGGTPLFFNFKGVENANDHFTIEPDYLDIQNAVQYWYKCINYLHKKQPDAVIIFNHFPMEQHRNHIVADRCRTFKKQFKAPKGCIVAPKLSNPHHFVEDGPVHFKKDVYAMYAGFAYGALKGVRRNKHRSTLSKIVSRLNLNKN